MPSIRALANVTIKPSMAWLLVFLPAFSYFVSTRLESSGFRWGRSNNLGDPISSTLSIDSSSSSSSSSTSKCHALSKIFFLSTTSNCDDDAHQQLPLKYSLNLQATGRGMKDIVASTWRHDEQLGRGYLLFSQSHHDGRIWRWEVGGGPIAIGRSLHLESSGCRSSEYQVCHNDGKANSSKRGRDILSVGSGGMAIDFHHAKGTRHSEGSLVVAEWGEGRIIRMEDNGARTPLLIQVPDICSTSSATTIRLNQPRSLIYTPYGDLLVADTSVHCSKAAIYRLTQAVQVEAVPSLFESRKAHGWNQTQHDLPVDLLYHASIRDIGGMAIETIA